MSMNFPVKLHVPVSVDNLLFLYWGFIAETHIYSFFFSQIQIFIYFLFQMRNPLALGNCLESIV